MKAQYGQYFYDVENWWIEMAKHETVFLFGGQSFSSKYIWTDQKVFTHLKQLRYFLDNRNSVNSASSQTVQIVFLHVRHIRQLKVLLFPLAGLRTASSL